MGNLVRVTQKILKLTRNLIRRGCSCDMLMEIPCLVFSSRQLGERIHLYEECNLKGSRGVKSEVDV
jgi:hypothetical protein